jgi:superfamily I DNA/RNA helicase
LPADVLTSALAAAQERVVNASANAQIIVVGPAGSGKTTTLAWRASACAKLGRVAVICAGSASARAFKKELERIGAQGQIRVDSLAGHLAEWMRAEYAAAGVSPLLQVGGPAATRLVIAAAARGLLDLSWPMFGSATFNLDLPFLGRPDNFLDEAAGLFRLLRRLRLEPDEFADGCSAGFDTFYGDALEAALARLSDPTIRARLSKRGAQACAATRAELDGQRRAERDLIRIVAELYAEYTAVLPSFAQWCEEDIVAHALGWLEGDVRAARAIAKRHVTILADDAEDADPWLPQLLSLLSAAGLAGFTIAGSEHGQIDAMTGTKAAMGAYREPAQRVVLAPRTTAASSVRAQRFGSESDEGAWLCTTLHDLIREGADAGSIAVLSRSPDAAAVYARLLKHGGLPVVEPTELFEAPDDIADLLAVAATIADPSDHAHLLRVLSSPLLGLSDATVWDLCRPADEVVQLTLDVGARGEHRRPDSGQRQTLLSENVFGGKADESLPAPVRERLSRFRGHFARWRSLAATQSPAAAVERLSQLAGFSARWAREPAYRQARIADDVRRLLEAIASMQEAEEEMRLPEIVCRIEEGEATLRPAARTAGAIACDAIPAAKGERWAHVFVAGVAYERFPRIYLPRGLAYSKNYGLLARENVAGRASQTAKFAWFYAKFDAKARYLAQERNVLRYGLDRADVSAAVTGFEKPPHWARDFDLLTEFGV